MNKIISLFAVFCIAIALLGCGGGGGGGSPVAPPAPTFDPALRNDLPTVAASYDSLAAALPDSNGLSASDRVAKFMLEIGEDFQNKAGTLASTSLKDITLDRLDRYTINYYTFIPEKYTKIDDNTIEVTTYMSISATRKPGKEGGFDGTTVLSPSPVVTWKKYGDGKWRILKGLPYLSEEVSF